MEKLAETFSIALPFFVLLVLAEKLYSAMKGRDTVPWMDALASMYIGLTFVLRALFGLGISIISYEFMYEHLALFHMETHWIHYLLTFIVLDFEFYWGHRLSHQINFLWKGHLIHHNSEEYNIATAVRQPFAIIFNYLFFLSIPAAILGLSPLVIAIVLPVHKLMQVWYHTRTIGKLGFLEYFLVTPSQHRVHHALNPIYIDKNYSAIFNIWDRLFGTLQEELEEEPVVYGVTRPSRTYNPITINFEHLILLLQDAWRAEKWQDKFTIWFRPTGWRPNGFEEKYPVNKITDHYGYEKFQPPVNKRLLIWSNVQLFSLGFVVFYSLFHIPSLGKSGLILLCAYTLIQTFSATELMNVNPKAPFYAVITSIFSLAIIFYDNSFFGFSKLHSMLPLLMILYFVIQTIVAYLLTKQTTIWTIVKSQTKNN
jgi:alkylglycerol monooxygenase